MEIINELKSWSVVLTLVSLSVLALCSSLQEDVFVLEHKNRPEKKTIVIITRIDEQPVDCVTHSNKMLVEDIMSSSGDYVQKKLSEKKIRKILKECATLSNPRKRRESEEDENCNDGDCGGDDCDGEDDCDDQMEVPSEQAELLWNIILPGTRWCGTGDIAEDYEDLGLLNNTDFCCRKHDNCDDYILSGQTKHNLTNNSEFTLLSCTCDDELYDCLSNLSTIFSNIVGRTYFNILQRPCFEKDYPLSTTCKTYRSFLKLTCKEYEKNTTVPKVYMLRPAKRYELLPLPVIG